MLNKTEDLHTMVIEKLFDAKEGDEAVANKLEWSQTVADAVGHMEELQNDFTHSVAKLRAISIILAKME
jgi:hypothetical protein